MQLYQDIILFTSTLQTLPAHYVYKLFHLNSPDERGKGMSHEARLARRLKSGGKPGSESLS